MQNRNVLLNDGQLSVDAAAREGAAWSLWPPSSAHSPFTQQALLGPPRAACRAVDTYFQTSSSRQGRFKTFLEEAEVNHEATGGPPAPGKV